MNIDNYIQELNSNENELFTVLATCDTETLLIKEHNNWNVLEILEHILITERSLLLMILKSSPTVSSVNEFYGEEKLKNILLADMNEKWLSPESLIPKGKLENVEAFRNAFVKHRENFKNQLSTNSLNIDKRQFEHPYLGLMTISDWLHFIIYHTERHVKQIKKLQMLNKGKYVLIIHQVDNYQKWEKVFKDAEKLRKQAGEISYQVLTYENDDKKVVHFSKWISHQEAKNFFESEELIEIRKLAGVSSPEFIYLNELIYGQFENQIK